MLLIISFRPQTLTATSSKPINSTSTPLLVSSSPFSPSLCSLQQVSCTHTHHYPAAQYEFSLFYTEVTESHYLLQVYTNYIYNSSFQKVWWRVWENWIILPLVNRSLINTKADECTGGALSIQGSDANPLSVPLVMYGCVTCHTLPLPEFLRNISIHIRLDTQYASSERKYIIECLLRNCVSINKLLQGHDGRTMEWEKDRSYNIH